MHLQVVLFYLFSALTLISAVLVIFSKNPVRAVLSLVLVFVASAFNWMLLEAEFLALSLVIVYVGAVMVLFLFVVMMLNVHVSARTDRFTHYLPLGLVLTGLVMGCMIWVLGPQYFGVELYPHAALKPEHYNNIKVLGMALFTDYIYPFEVAGALLVAAMVAAIGLTFRGVKSRRVQEPAEQAKVTKADRLQIVQME